MVFQKMPSNHFSYVFFRIELSLLLLEQCRHQMLQSSWIILYKKALAVSCDSWMFIFKQEYKAGKGQKKSRTDGKKCNEPFFVRLWVERGLLAVFYVEVITTVGLSFTNSEIGGWEWGGGGGRVVTSTKSKWKKIVTGSSIATDLF